MPNWMTTLYNAGIGFENRPLSNITIPGTHDAGCYIIHPFPSNTFDAFSRTQTVNIGQQLADGIRYFDIRPKVSGNNFRVHHNVYWGDQIDGDNGILSQVTDFMNSLTNNDRELVILNFSHFEGFNNNARHNDLIQAIRDPEGLGIHLIPHTQAGLDLFQAQYDILLTSSANVTRSRVAIIYDGALDTEREAYIVNNALPSGFFKLSPKYPAINGELPIYLFDQYSKINDLAILRNDQMNKLLSRQGLQYGKGQTWAGAGNQWGNNAQGGVASTLHLFSWTLTPQPNLQEPLIVAKTRTNPALASAFSFCARAIDLANNPESCRLASTRLDTNYNPRTTNWLSWNYDPANDPKINILYVDYYNSHTYDNPNSPSNGWALPVALAAQLNVGPIWPMTW